MARQGTESSTRARWSQTAWQGARSEPSKLAPPTLTTQSPRWRRPLGRRSITPSHSLLKSSRPRLTRTLSAATHVSEIAGKESGRRPRKSRWARRQRPSQRTTLRETSATHAGRRPRCCRLDASRRVATVRDASRYWSLLILVTPRTPCVSPQSIMPTDDGTYPVRTSTRAQSVSMATHTRRMR